MWVHSKARQYAALESRPRAGWKGLTEPLGQLATVLALKERRKRSRSVKTRKRNKTKYQNFSQIPKFPYGRRRKYPANSRQPPLVRKDLKTRHVCEPTEATCFWWMAYQRSRLGLIQCGKKKVHFLLLLFMLSPIYPFIEPPIHQFVHFYNKHILNAYAEPDTMN